MAEQQIGVEGQVGNQMGEQFASDVEQGLSGAGTGSDGRVMMTAAYVAVMKMFFG